MSRRTLHLDDKVLVYPYLPLYYYLTATANPTRDEYFQPGMHTPQQAQEMLAEIGRARAGCPVRHFILGEDSNFVAGNTAECDCPGPDSDYIQREYRMCKILNSPDEWKFLVHGAQGFGMPLKAYSGRAIEFVQCR